MRIAIVTQPLLSNYGGLLQNYALQKILKNDGHLVVTIDLKVKNYYKSLVPVIIIRLRAFIKKMVRGISSYRPSIPRYQNRKVFSDVFIRENIHITKPVKKYTSNILRKYKIQVCIVGSDQVWRPKYNHYLEDMYLKFAKNEAVKRIAYAVSFGVDEWEYTAKQTIECSILAKKFKAISVREESGVELCKKNLDIAASWVLDPTLLLERKEYLKLCESIPTNSKHYLAAYVLNLSDPIRKSCEQIAYQKGLELKLFSADSQATLSVPEWLAMFRDASYVVTDSFHGTVFSIIFEKEFKCIYNEARGSARFESLINLYNSGKLEEMRQFSLNWLRNSLES